MQQTNAFLRYIGIGLVLVAASNLPSFAQQEQIREGQTLDPNAEAKALIRESIKKLEFDFTAQSIISLTGELPEDTIRIYETNLPNSDTNSFVLPNGKTKNQNASSNGAVSDSSQQGRSAVLDTTTQGNPQTGIPDSLLSRNIKLSRARELAVQAEQQMAQEMRRFPPRKKMKRNYVTTAGQDYSVELRKGLRNDLRGLLDKIPEYVMFFLHPREINIAGNTATVSAVYFFRAFKFDTDRSRPFTSLPETPISLRLRKINGQWLVTDFSDIVTKMRADILK